MTIRYFREEDVAQLLDMACAIKVMNDAFCALAADRAHNVPRVRAKGSGIVLHSMCASADYLGVVGWKQYTTTRQGARFLVGLHEQASGRLITLIEADRLGQLRTGAVTGLAVKLLAAQSTDQVGLIGTGWQAQSQLEAVASVLPIRTAICYSRRRNQRQAFAEKMSEQLGIDVVAVDQPESAVQGMPLVITATTSSTPVFNGAWLHSGTLVCAVGSNWLHKAEIDETTIRRAGRVICDSVESCQNEAGDLAVAADRGSFDFSRAVELAEIVTRPTESASMRHDVNVFKSVGMALEDVALAAKLLELATNTVGRSIDI